MVMVSSTGANEFIKFVKDRFFTKRVTDGKNIDQLIFATNPSEGACMYFTPSDCGIEGRTRLPTLVHL